MCNACNALNTYFRDIQTKLDIIICYSAMTNNAGLDGRSNEIVKESILCTVKDIIPILFGIENVVDIEELFKNVKSQYSRENIVSHRFDSKLNYALLKILECCNILKDINVARASNYIFDKSIFARICLPSLPITDSNIDELDKELPKFSLVGAKTKNTYKKV